MLAYSIGRMGCQLAGDGCWGIKNEHSHSILPDWIWKNEYIGAIHGQPLDELNKFYISVFPTPIYVSLDQYSSKNNKKQGKKSLAHRSSDFRSPDLKSLAP